MNAQVDMVYIKIIFISFAGEAKKLARGRLQACALCLRFAGKIVPFCSTILKKIFDKIEVNGDFPINKRFSAKK